MIAGLSTPIKPLRKEFEGIGEVRGYQFRQISATSSGFIYEITFGKGKHYEVFKKRVNARHGNESYPTAKAFGKWAWTFNSLEKAKSKLRSLSE